jgi:hypothetical protein
MADQQMNDDVLDRALREALDVAPSPDFVARVRTRIASEPAPRGVFSGWMLWTPIAACATAAAIALAVWIGRPAPQVHQGMTESIALVAAPEPTQTPTSPTVRPPSPLRGYGATRPVVASRKESEVLISPEESSALRRLIARASEGQIVVNDSPPTASELGGELKPLPEIEPLKIDPIVPVNGEEGVRQ